MSPLDGIRAVDFARTLAGPFCTKILGDLGADVTKVERSTVGEACSVNMPLQHSEMPPSMQYPAPTLGQHTDEVLREPGYDDATTHRWHDDGTI